jgi:hypothetical protein
MHGNHHAAAPIVTGLVGRNYLQSQPLPARHGEQHEEHGGESLHELLNLLLQNLKEPPTSRAEASASHAVNGLSETVPSRGSNPLAPQPQADSQREWQAVLNKPRDWGRSRWVNKAPEFNTMIRCYREIMGGESKDASFQAGEAAALITQARDFLQKCKSRAKFSKVSRPTRGIACPWLDLTPPSREMADELARLYFASFESTYVCFRKCTLRDLQRNKDADLKHAATAYSTPLPSGPSTKDTGTARQVSPLNSASRSCLLSG